MSPDGGRRRLVAGELKEQIEETVGYKSLHESLWVSLQILAAAGVDDSIPDLTILRCVYFLALLAGLVIFAILVGFITDSVTTFMDSLDEGRTKVVTLGHTLILGSNEATPRLVTQLAQLRKQYKYANNKWYQKWLGLKWLPPSTPVRNSTLQRHFN